MWWMLVVTLKATAVLAVSGCVAVLLRKASAATRHLVWSVGIVSALMVPVLSLIVPSWTVPFAPISVATDAWPSDVTSPEVDSRYPLGEDMAERKSVDDPDLDLEAPLSAAVPSVAGPDLEASLSADVPSASAVSPSRQSSARSMIWLVWSIGAFGSIAVVLFSIVRVGRINRRAAPIYDRRIKRIADRLVVHMSIVRPVRFVESRSSCMPMTWGVFEPTVLLPESSHEWETDRINAVLLHELAHVKRWDYVTQLVARLACAVYWFNPIVWLAARELRVERERACDDAVLSSGSKASAYANHLLEIARSLHTGSVVTIASVAMAKPSQLSGRLLAVLDRTRRRRSVTYGTVFGAAVASLGSLPRYSAMASPNLVAITSGMIFSMGQRSHSMALRHMTLMSGLLSPRKTR